MRRALAAEVVDVARSSPHPMQSEKTSLGLWDAGRRAAVHACVLLHALPHRTLELDQAAVSTPDDGSSLAALQSPPEEPPGSQGPLPDPSGATILKGSRGQSVDCSARRNLNTYVGKRPRLLIGHTASKGRTLILATHPPFSRHLSVRVECYDLAEDDCAYS